MTKMQKLSVLKIEEQNGAGCIKRALNNKKEENQNLI